MSFDRPWLLWLAMLTLPELALCLWRLPRLRASLALLAGPRRRQRAVEAYSALSIVASLAAALFVASAALAMAGPSWGESGASVERRGLEAAIVLDVSRSMEATDIEPSRLEAAKSLVRSLLGASAARSSPSESASFSLVAAKGAAVLLVPMTEDRIGFEESLDYADPEVTTAPGSDLSAGIRAGLASFTAEGAQGRILFVFSDGGGLPGSARNLAASLAEAKARLVVVGVGGRNPAPVPGSDGQALSGPAGPVQSRLEEAGLKALAASSSGRYLDASDPGTGPALSSELSEARGTGPRIEYAGVDRSGLFSLLALVALAAAILAELLAPRRARA